MKKALFLAVVAVSLLATATSEAVASENVKVEVTEEVTYQEIDVKELPAAVIKSIKVEYVDGVITKAFKGTDSSFKVEIKLNDKNHKVCYNKEGKKIENAK